MADKGFDLKVLIPTDDGFNISDNGIKNCRYYLMYNISNRSYQLAGKIKLKEFYAKGFNINSLQDLLETENIDIILTVHQKLYDLPYDHVKNKEISIVLNGYIEFIDKKKALIN